MEENFIYPIYKPKGPTSHWVVNQLRKITGIKKIGHAGTLDPLASGVLVIGITRQGTKTMHDHVQTEKEYLATIKLGETSTTDDEEGDKQTIQTSINLINSINEKKIEEVLRRFVGKIQQVPPKYSALKIKGKAVYKYAREGKEVEMKAREVEIKEIEVLGYNYPMLQIRVVTGPGVYIRSLARDIGEALGTGGYLAELERTRVGAYTKEDALSLDAFSEIWKKQQNMES